MPGMLGNKPIEPHHVEVMNALAKGIDKALNGDAEEKLNGFILMVFPLDSNPGRCNYISSANRSDVIVLLKEQLRYFEGQAEGQVGMA